MLLQHMLDLLSFPGSGQPEEQAGWWQKLTFSYANGLIDLGYSQPLHQEHLWSMAKQNEAGLVASKFQAALAATKDPVKTPHVSKQPQLFSCVMFGRVITV